MVALQSRPIAHEDLMRAISHFLLAFQRINEEGPPRDWIRQEDGDWPRTYRLFGPNGAIGFLYFENQRYEHSALTVSALLNTLEIPPHVFTLFLPSVAIARSSARP